MTERQCDVCQQTISKYKCAACDARSCSLPCFKSHKAICAGEQPVRQEAVEEDKPRTQEVVEKLSVKEELDQLFQQHPQLRTKLDAIYQETLDPRSRRTPFQSARNPRFEHHWTEEKGFEQGLRVLKAKLQTDSADQDDLRAFAVFVSSRADQDR